MSKKILIVDDEEDVLYIIRRILSKKGYTISEVKSGEECLEVLKKDKPDLIIMDIMMPGLDGWETTRKIKTDESTKDIPVSMLSVKDDSEDVRKSFEYSFADEHLGKPIDFSTLLNVVETLA